MYTIPSFIPPELLPQPPITKWRQDLTQLQREARYDSGSCGDGNFEYAQRRLRDEEISGLSAAIQHHDCFVWNPSL